jgi:hypothetical protein
MCPLCRATLPSSGINVTTNVAYCATCNQGFPLSDLVTTDVTPATPFDLDHPPRGCWYREITDGWEIGSTLRHPAAFFMVPFMLVWSGFSLGGIYGTQIFEQKFNLLMSLFGIPFLAGTVLFGGLTLLMICGKTSISMVRGEGCLFIGIGSIGYRRRFQRGDIDLVHEESISNGSGRQPAITLQGRQRLTFAQGLNEERRYFLLRALRRLLTKESGSANR